MVSDADHIVIGVIAISKVRDVHAIGRFGQPPRDDRTYPGEAIHRGAARRVQSAVRHENNSACRWIITRRTVAIGEADNRLKLRMATTRR